MKKRMRLLIVTVMVMQAAMIAFAAGTILATEVQYADVKNQFSFNFSNSDDHCSIGGKYNTSGKVVIPQKVTVKKADGVNIGDRNIATYTVTEIVGFANNKNITSLTIPDGIQKIGAGAFQFCTGLRGDLIIPDSVKEIGDQAFKGCTGLTGRLSLGKGLTKIEDSVFLNCGFTGDLVIPSSITSIGGYAFQKCKGFKGDLTIPSSVTSIGWDAFRDCSGFNGTLTIPANAGRNGRTFYGCSGFTGLKLSSGITRIEGSEFYGCSGMTGTLTIPDTVTRIGNSAFAGCCGFSGTLKIPSGVTEIYEDTFKECSGFTGLSLPSQITEIDRSAFEGCTGMTGTLTLPDSLTKVYNDAFSGCGFTGDLKLPERLTDLCEGAFACPNIDGTLTIPASIDEYLVIDYPFRGMWKVKTIVNNSSASLYLINNFISKDDTVSYFVKSGTTEHLRIYMENKWTEEAKETISKGTYVRGGTAHPTDDPTPVAEQGIKTKPSSVKTKVSKNKVTVSWNKINKKTSKGKKLLSQIKYIQVQCATDKGFKNIVKDQMIGKTKTKITLKLGKKTTYYIRVRYVGNNKKSGWSKTKKVKTKK